MNPSSKLWRLNFSITIDIHFGNQIAHYVQFVVGRKSFEYFISIKQGSVIMQMVRTKQKTMHIFDEPIYRDEGCLLNDWNDCLQLKFY